MDRLFLAVNTFSEENVIKIRSYLFFVRYFGSPKTCLLSSIKKWLSSGPIPFHVRRNLVGTHPLRPQVHFKTLQTLLPAPYFYILLMLLLII